MDFKLTLASATLALGLLLPLHLSLADDGDSARDPADAKQADDSVGTADEELIKITPQRLPMDKRLLTLCAGPGAVVGPHHSAEIDIHVNPAVVKYRTDHPQGHAYPVGSRFVKKKYPRVGAKKPDIATVMVKKSDTGKVTDWEFSMIRLSDGKALNTRKNEMTCAECHEKYESRGFISKKSEDALVRYLKSL